MPTAFPVKSCRGRFGVPLGSDVVVGLNLWDHVFWDASLALFSLCSGVSLSLCTPFPSQDLWLAAPLEGGI